MGVQYFLYTMDRQNDTHLEVVNVIRNQGLGEKENPGNSSKNTERHCIDIDQVTLNRVLMSSRVSLSCLERLAPDNTSLAICNFFFCRSRIFCSTVFSTTNLRTIINIQMCQYYVYSILTRYSCI